MQFKWNTPHSIYNTSNTIQHEKYNTSQSNTITIQYDTIQYNTI